MTIILDGSTGISSIGTLTGVTSISSAAANTAVVMQDSGTNSNTCRAWVNFNGTGTVAIRASFNVSSITDNGTGDYTVNFTVAMPDADYSAQVSAQITASSFLQVFMFGTNGPTLVNPTASGFRFWTANYNTATSNADSAIVCATVFR